MVDFLVLRLSFEASLEFIKRKNGSLKNDDLKEGVLGLDLLKIYRIYLSDS